MAAKKSLEDGLIDITLKRPIEIDGVKVSALRMREPLVADQLASSAAKGGSEEKEIALFANLCEISPDDLQRMTMRDYKQLQQAYMDFTS